MNRILSVLIFSVAFSTHVSAQKIPLIHSGEVIDRGKFLYDSGAYEKAIAQYLTVPKRDTNYVYMLTELALAYTANEQYDKALAVCEEALSKPSIHQAHLLRTQAIATDKKGEYAKSVALFQKAIEKYPFDYSLIYNLGITYYNGKEYDKAIDCFFNVLELNPFHSGSHLNLGRISIGRGRKTHAVLSFGMYLSLSNQDNGRLVFIDKFLSNQVEEEGSLTASGTNACEKLDQILRSKIAMDNNFKTKVPVSAPVVKQFEMFFEQLSTINTKTDDRWVQYYLPIYTTLKEQNTIEPFIYNILASADNDDVKKWRKKNEKILDNFYGIANVALKKKREVLTPPSRFGFKEPVQAWYNDNRSLDALGVQKNDKNEGHWIYFHDTYEISAEGVFTNGTKTGIWKYYYPTGEVRSIENSETGEITTFFKTGAKHQHYYLNDNNTEGDVEFYFASGGLREKLLYKQDKRNGPGQSFYPSGKKEMTYQYTDNNATGEFVSYFENGQVYNKSPYKEDKLHGKYEEYFAHGNLRMSGEYVEGEVNGPWKYYYSNGQLEKEGSSKNGLTVGEWVFYDKQGLLTGKMTFNDKGEYHGDHPNYNEGKLYYTQTYKNDILVKLVYVDRSGKEIGKFENSNGTFSAKTFYHSGQLNSEGAYKKGKADGTWRYYNPEGTKLSEYTYVDGLAQGVATEYFRSGAIKYIFPYKDNRFDGYFSEFYPDGKVKQEGWYKDGLRQQQWLTYYSDGTLESDYYYLNGVTIEATYDYNNDGKLYVTTLYDLQGNVTDIQYVNATGKVITKTRLEKGKKIFETFHTSGKPKTRFDILEGVYTGSITKWFPDGSIYYTFPMMNNQRHGTYKYYSITNQLEVEGSYVNGQQEGKWTGYTPNGLVDYTGVYINGERDSLWTNYFPHGGVSSLIAYKDDERHGVSRYNSLEGTPILEKLYERGSLVAYRKVNPDNQFGEWTLFTGNTSISVQYSNGKIAMEEHYKNGLLDGVRKLYFNTGKLYSEYSYKEGNYEGPYKMYYPSGKMREQGEYHNDELHGVIESFNEDGTLFKSETFLLGSRNGKAIVYKKGAKVKEINFWAGTPD